MAVQLEARVPRLLTDARLLAFLNVVLALAIVAAYWKSGQSDHVDAHVYLDSGADILRGEGPYQVIKTWMAQGYWLEDLRPRPTVYAPYVYPPVLAIAMIPLVPLPRPLAISIWYTLSFLAVLLAAFVLARIIVGRNLTGFLVMANLLVYFQPIRRNFYFGQVDVVVLCFLMLGLAAFLSRRDTLAGLAIAAGIAIKPFVGFVVLYFLWKRAYRAAIVTVLASGLLVGGSLLALGPGTVIDYVTATSYWVSPQAASSIGNQVPSGMLLRAFTSLNVPARIVELPWLVLPLRIVVGLIVFASLVYLMSRNRVAPTPLLVAEFGLMMPAMLLISPLGEDIHFVYLIVTLVGCAALVAASWQATPSMYLVGAGLALVYGIFVIPLHVTLLFDGPFYALCLLVLVCTVAFVVATRRPGIPRPGTG